MSKRYSGSCLCGAVQFQVAGEFERFYLCHCDYCRKDTGSAHAANLFSSTARLRWTAGADTAMSFSLPGTRHRKCFCSICGSALPYETDDMLVVPAGCLDGPVALRPQAHLFAASRAQWDQRLDDVPEFDRFPP
jgi:hypothetical protein